MLDVHRLRLLRELRHHGTLAAVARALGYSPSTVSHQLDVLERRDSRPFRMCGRRSHGPVHVSTSTDSWSRRMRERELKEDLHRQLRAARAAVLWKLDGLSE